MSLPIWQRTITTETGDIVPGAEVEVVNEATGLPADIFSDREGSTERSNPFFATSNGFAQFYAAPGEYRITATGPSGSQTWRWNVLAGTASTMTNSTGDDTLRSAAGLEASVIPWLSTAPGETRGQFINDPALYPPTDNELFRYVILTEGLEGAGQYNDGLLINETITGSGVERQVTAEIATGPLMGEVVHLINSERSHLRPGETAGDFQQDQMQRITGGAARVWAGASGTTTSGAFVSTQKDADVRSNIGSTDGSYNLSFNSADSPDARTSATTDGATEVKSVSNIVFLRIM